jgi:membrane associated rhomboid family serine protease
MWTLWIFGDNVEDRMGPVRFSIFYLLCGTAAGLTHLYVNPDSTVPSVGASGAIAGVLGAYFLFFPTARLLVLFPIFFFPFFSNCRLCFIWPSGFSFNYLAGRWPWPARNRSVASPGGRTLADLWLECCHAGCL